MGVKTSVKIDGVMVATVVVVALGVFVYTQRDAIVQSVKDTANKVNPASEQNLANQGVNSFTYWATDGKWASPADWLHCRNYPEDPDCARRLQ